MSEETPGQAVALSEIAEIRKATPFGTPSYTPEVDKRVQALYRDAYPEPAEEGEAPKSREFPEVIKQRKEVKQRETTRRRVVADDDDDDAALGSFPIRGYTENWGNHEPTSRDIRQWDKAVSVAAKIGVSPTQLGKLRDAMLETAPVTDDDDGGDYSVDDYPPPFSIPDENSWRIYKAAREIAARHSVSPAAFRELSSLVLAGNEVIGEPQMIRAQRAAVFDLIHNVGEDRAVSVVRNARKAFDHFAPSDRAIDRLMATPVAGALTVGDHPAMIELLGNVGQAISFDALPREFRSPNGDYNPPKHRGNPMKENDVLARIKELEAKAPLGRRTREEDREITALYEAMYNDDEPDVSRSAMGSLWK